jgi:hypothetical protein
MVLLSNFSNAKPLPVIQDKSNTATLLLRSKCDIIWHNVYDYCTQHGFSGSEASQIACAAETACEKKK